MTDRRERSRRLAFIGTLIAIFMLVGFVVFPLCSGVVAPLVPRKIADAVGAEMVKDTAQLGNFCTEPAGRAALERLAQRLAAHSDQSFKIYVSDQESFNAFAAPGGNIVIYQPIITRADSAEEVAGVLAHEMGHVMEGHPTKGLVESVGYGLFSAVTLGRDQVEEAAKSLLTSYHSRRDELNADLKGVALLNAAGIDSRGLFSFFDRIQDAGQLVPGAVEFMSTHPTSDARRDNLEGFTRAGSSALSPEEWAALELICTETGMPDPVIVSANH